MTRFFLLLAALLPLGSAYAQSNRIVTLAPHLAELVCAAGACDKLVGVVRFTDYPAEAAARPKVGDAINLNYEQILALRPDLVLSWDGGTSPQVVARLRELNLLVVPIQIRTLNDVAGALARVGQLAGSKTAAGLAVSLYYRRLDALRKANRRKSRLKVMYQIELGPIYTISARSPINEAISLCGGDNVFARLPQIAPTVSLEAVVAADPDVVVFSQQDDVAKIRAFWAQWPQARAPRANNLFTVDSNLLDRQSPRMLGGVEQLCLAFDRARQHLLYGPGQ